MILTHHKMNRTLTNATVISYRKCRWSSLKGGIIRNSTVILSGYTNRDAHGMVFGPLHLNNGPKFMADTLYVNNCDEKFVYYWIDKFTFPYVKTLYLFSHPCEKVLHRKFDTIYLEEEFYTMYKDRWARNLDNVLPIYIKYKDRWVKNLDNVLNTEYVDISNFDLEETDISYDITE